MSEARARSRNATSQQVDRFETEQREFFERVRTGYLHRAAAQPDRFAVIDASGDRDSVANSIKLALDKTLNDDL